jgi:hypothetical protein
LSADPVKSVAVAGEILHKKSANGTGTAIGAGAGFVRGGVAPNCEWVEAFPDSAVVVLIMLAESNKGVWES